MLSRLVAAVGLVAWWTVAAEGATLVQGHCWIDDDPQFDAGQIDAGLVLGRSSFDLRKECAYVATERYGANGSSAVSDVTTVTGGDLVQADCWIDDDTDFDFGQTSGGKLIGTSTYEIRQECALIARERYGAVSSSGLQNAQLASGSLGGLIQGHCWLDDDPQFDEGQIDGGLLYGRSSLSLRQECAYAARARYGNQGSSHVTDLTPANGNAVQADCWIDDDASFDFGQTSGGTLIGESTWDIRQECAFIAKERYGEVSSSDLQNAKPISVSGTGLLQGHCWLDDDPQFDAGQVDGGLMFAFGSKLLREECAYAAKERYKDQGSSSVTDIQAVSGAFSSVKAECWIDDDPDFDMGQVFGGGLVGQSSFDLRQECALIARERYGANGSSGLSNVSLAP
jgi:hypothetical protein